MLSFASLIPGGLGVMEGSMAAVFASMGVPFETAVVAVLLFRIVYRAAAALSACSSCTACSCRARTSAKPLAAADQATHERAPKS